MERAEPEIHVVLVEPEIHWNTGNAGRSCLAAGARLHLVEPLGFSLDEREVRRAGLDYWPRVDLQVWSSWAEIERRLPELGEPFFFSSEATRSFWSVQYPRHPQRVVLVYGKESVGLDSAIRERWRDRLVGIPMQNPALRSLNLSTSVALGLYEVLRQQQFPHQAPPAAPLPD
ncbi:MAG TPA: tRNA (cytidine(34)-2'-O)-methyltransferase [Thermoanaerobaculia bacterium]|nr:tRNA (cytidine(34)-2'-O)-methyltransferase [Thermoanaerobaculia bacterium]